MGPSALLHLFSLARSHQTFVQQRAEKRFDFGGTFFVFDRQIVPHFPPHEHGVGADVDDPALLAQALYQSFDLRIDQGLAAAD